jgi:hypothetical protein
MINFNFNKALQAGRRRYPRAMRVIEILEFIKRYEIEIIDLEKMLGLIKRIEPSSRHDEVLARHDIRTCLSLILGLTIQNFIEKEIEFNSHVTSSHGAYRSEFAEMFISELRRAVREDGDIGSFHFLWLGWDLSGNRPLISPEMARHVVGNLEEHIVGLIHPSSPAVAMTKHQHGLHGGPRLTLLVLNRLTSRPQGSRFEAKFKKGRIYAEFQAIESVIGKAADKNRQVEKTRDIFYWALWGGITILFMYQFGFFGLIMIPLYWGLHFIAFSIVDRLVFDKQLINLDEIKFDN